MIHGFGLDKADRGRLNKLDRAWSHWCSVFARLASIAVTCLQLEFRADFLTQLDRSLVSVLSPVLLGVALGEVQR